jgi:1-deoxy-D-xylulose-5-phosphate reductoisomerase
VSLPVVVLGATGSIGSQTLEVADALGLEVRSLVARRPGQSLAALASRYPDANVVVTGGSNEEREDFALDTGRSLGYGMDAVLEQVSVPGVVVVNGIVGAAGLQASVSTLEAGNRLALANKESLVAGGPVVKAALARGGEMIPVDSEHSALHQCLVGEPEDSIGRLILTASGGPFRGWSRERLEEVTPEQALKHPNWDMGQRITVDSATLFNKGLEIIEAQFLFDVDYDRIEVVVHPQSILHSFVEFVDGSWKGQLGFPDMRLPIQYALTAPQRLPGPTPKFDIAGMSLDFESVDRETFPAIDLAFEAGRAGGSAPAVLNAGDEIAVEAFLQGRLGFTGIWKVVEETLGMVEQRSLGSVEDVVEVDREARGVAAGLVAGAC